MFDGRGAALASCALLGGLWIGVAPARGPDASAEADASPEAVDSAEPSVADTTSKGTAVEQARALLAANKPAEAVALLETALEREVGDGTTHSTLGQALLKLGRRDQAAHHLELAVHKLAGEATELAIARKKLVEADPLATKREALFKRGSKAMLEAARKLRASEDSERALALLERAAPLATAPEIAEIGALIAEIRSASTEVSLDDASSDPKPSTVWPVFEHESERYALSCNLEPAVVVRLGEVMDDIWNYYVRVYFDGDEGKAGGQKARIRIFESQGAMGGYWEGSGDTPLGWWNPGKWEVVTFDTSTDRGSLDPMLVTLFHEASHQFMTMLAGGSAVPAWVNEGTASFFEGAVAMADGRVLWPDAAYGRMVELEHVRRLGAPTVLDVISYSSPASYPGEYYSVGWGLIYFAQQYEDPATLEYVYRPLYARYREEVIKKGGDSRALFEQIFLGPKSPGKFATIDEFATAWAQWLDERVYPLHQGDQRRERRVEAIERYVAAADRARGNRKAPVAENELLLRALGHAEYVRTKVDREPDGKLLAMQADILQRLDRPRAAAPVVEQLLDLVDAGKHELAPGRYAELEKVLTALDGKNAALRNARGRAKALAVEARRLLGEYEAKQYVLRSYTLAKLTAAAFEDGEVLAPAAQRLRETAREARILDGALYALDAPKQRWSTIFTNAEGAFEVDGARVALEGVRPVGRICETVPIQGEYEVRAELSREGASTRASVVGVVFSGQSAGDWYVFGIDGRGNALIQWLATTAGGNAVPRTIKADRALARPIAADAKARVAIRVSPSGAVEARVDDQEPLSFTLPRPLPATGHVGLYAKDVRAVVEHLVVEVFP